MVQNGPENALATHRISDFTNNKKGKFKHY